MALGGPNIYPFPSGEWARQKYGFLVRPLRRHTLPEIRGDEERNILELGSRAAGSMRAEYVMTRFFITRRARHAYPYPPDSLEHLVLVAERQHTGQSKLRFTHMV